MFKFVKSTRLAGEFSSVKGVVFLSLRNSIVASGLIALGTHVLMRI